MSHRRGKSAANGDLRSELEVEEERVRSRQGTRGSPPPTRGILKKTAAFEKLESRTSQPKDSSSNVSRLPSFSISGINEVSTFSVESVERLISTLPDLESTPRFLSSKPSPRSPKPSEAPASLLVDDSLIQEVDRVIQTIKSARFQAASMRIQAKQARLKEALAILEAANIQGKEKDQSLVVLGTDLESGSETERKALGNNRAAMKAAVRALVTDPRQLDDLLEVIDTSGTPRLSLLMRRNRVEGLYRQGPGGWRKLYGAKEAPTTVDPAQVTGCFELREAALAPVSQKQLWKADAFTL